MRFQNHDPRFGRREDDDEEEDDDCGVGSSRATAIAESLGGRGVGDGLDSTTESREAKYANTVVT